MRVFPCLVLLIFALSAHADGSLSGADSQALKQTQDLLRDPGQRQKAINADSKARDIDKKVDALAGSPENKDEVYDMAAQLVEKIAAQANGDPEKMQQLLSEAQKNPKGFYDKYFSAEQKAKVRDIANKSQKRPVETDKSN